MAHREVYARVVTPLCLPGGCILHPGQSIEPGEMAALGEERLGKLLGRGAVELRNRQAADASGILRTSVLKDAIEREREELAAFDRAFAQAVAGAEGAGAGRSHAPACEDADRSPPHSGETLRAVARSLFALAEAHRDLRREFDALVAVLAARGAPE